MIGRLREHAPGFAAGALALVISVLLILGQDGYVPSSDSADYQMLATRVLDGDGFTRGQFDKPTAIRGPLYPLFLAGAFALPGPDAVAGRLATALLGALAVFLLYLLVLRLWGRGPAIAGAALAAVWPPLLASSTGFFTEPLFLVLELGALFFALRFRDDPRLVFALAVGVLCGLATVTRTNGFLMLIGFVPALFIAAASRKRGLVAVGVALLAAGLVAAPWAIRNEAAFGRLTLSTQTGYALLFVMNDGARGTDGDYSLAGALAASPPAPEGLRTDEAVYGDVLTEQALDYMRAHPEYVLKAGVLNTLRTLELWPGSVTGFVSWGDNGLPPSFLARSVVPASFLLYALAVAGLVTLVRRKERAPALVLLTVPLILLVSPALTAGALRYRVPFDPVLLALGGLALARLVEGARGTYAPSSSA